MKTIIFDKHLHLEEVIELIKEIQSNPFDKYIQLYFSTTGGHSAPTIMLIDFINTRKDLNIELIAFSQLYSSGFTFFFNCKCKRRILDDVAGLVHLWSDNYAEREKYNERQIFDRKMLEELNNDYLKKIMPLLTVEEIEKIEKWEEVWLDTNRLRKILDNQQSIL